MTQKTLAKHLGEYTALAQQIASLGAEANRSGQNQGRYGRPRKCRQAHT
ncbi:MAG: hypothetical protein ACLSBB_16085 [Ruthenibacterium lactatiformans]